MLRERLSEALKEAAKAQDRRAVSTLRLILAALKDNDIAARGKGKAEGLGDDEILALLQKMVKQRHESVALYQQGNREDLVKQEEEEIAVIQRFLPQSMSADETQAAVDSVISEIEANSIKDMGRVMATLKERYPGRMDFAKASAFVKAKLA